MALHHLVYECEPHGCSPVEAWGRYRGFAWEFYARWDHWDFTLSVDPSIDPVTLDLRGRTSADVPKGVFFHEQRYTGPLLASYMDAEEAAAAIRHACMLAEEWLVAQGLVTDG